MVYTITHRLCALILLEKPKTETIPVERRMGDKKSHYWVFIFLLCVALSFSPAHYLSSTFFIQDIGSSLAMYLLDHSIESILMFGAANEITL